jgi:hypothetical protein
MWRAVEEPSGTMPDGAGRMSALSFSSSFAIAEERIRALVSLP